MTMPTGAVAGNGDPPSTPRGWLFALPWDPRRPGGVDQVVLNLYRQMEHHGAFAPRIFIASWDHPALATSVDDGRPTARMRLRSPVGASATVAPLLRWLATLPQSVRLLADHLRGHQVAVVNVHFPGLWALQFAMVKRWLLPDLRLILSFHGLDIGAAAQTSGWTRWWWRRLLRAADALAGCSDNLCDQIRAFDPRVAGKVVTIHNGLDAAAFLAEEDRDCKLDARLVGRPYILNVAAFEPKKGLDVLIRAYAALVAGGSDALLVLVGVDRGIRADLEALAASLGVGDRVLTFADVPHAQLHPFFRAATVFCLPSRSEPFGLVLLEAGAFALPVVASRVGGIPEVIAHGATGRLVAPEDVPGLADELAFLLARPDERTRLGRALQARMQAHFTWTDAYRRYVTLAGNKGD